MTHKNLFLGLSLIVVVAGGIFAFKEYKESAYYIDETFSNKIDDNKQFPAILEGECFGGTDLLSAEVLRETSSSLLIYVTYCNEEIDDRVVLDVWVDDGSSAAWASTPGGTVLGHGDGYVRLQVSDLVEPVTVSDYTIQLYRNNSGKTVVKYPFYHEKVWCSEKGCDE